jgi:hypothetical protein
MDLPFRKVVNLGPLHLTFRKRRLKSWRLKLGRWSWGSRPKSLPGPLSKLG